MQTILSEAFFLSAHTWQKLKEDAIHPAAM